MENKYLKDYPEVSRRTIWNFRQNNPELVVRDARDYLGLDDEQCEALRTFMLSRGINKWLVCRRDLIAYKKRIKKSIRKINDNILTIKSRMCTIKGIEFHKLARERHVQKELLKFCMKVRSDLKKICMTDRWQIWPKGHCNKKIVTKMNTIKESD